MAYIHGVTTREVPTAVPLPSSVATVPVVFGTAPVNMVSGTAPVNIPLLITNLADAAQKIGYSSDFGFSLNEFFDSHFGLYGMSPVIVVNVLDPAKHKEDVPVAPLQLVNGTATIEKQGILLPSLVVTSSDGSTTYVKDTDYSAGFDLSGNVVISRITTGTIPNGSTALKVQYTALDPSKVTAADVIGGITADGAYSGLELLDKVFPMFTVIPGLIVAPGFSGDPTVAAVMAAKAEFVNGLFKSFALTDLDASKNTTEIAAWKDANGYTSGFQDNFYPMVTRAGKKYHLSTQAAGVICATDATFGSIPYVSPSNQTLKADGACLADGTPLFLGPDQAQVLNGEGIVTALNFIGGWKLWGNRTGAYPASSDPVHNFTAVRRMMNFIHNTVITTFWSRLDGPITNRLTQSVVDDLNVWLNGLTSAGALVGGRVEFNASENSIADMMDGIVHFHIYATPPSPAREIEFIVEYDASYLAAITA